MNSPTQAVSLATAVKAVSTLVSLVHLNLFLAVELTSDEKKLRLLDVTKAQVQLYY